MEWNKKTAFLCNGASNHTDEAREVNDYYATDPKAVDILINDAGITFLSEILDKTTPRLIQFHTLKNAVNPPFLGGFLFSGTVAA